MTKTRNDQELWDDPTDAGTFFGVPAEPAFNAETKEEESPKEGETEEEDETEKEDDVDFFKDGNEEDEEDENPKPKKKSKPVVKKDDGEDADDEDPKPNVEAISDWAERMGIDSEDIENSFDDILEQKLADTLEGFSEETRQALLFEKNGGNIRDFFKSNNKEVVIDITSNLDMEEEDNQLAVIIQDQINKGDDRDAAESYAEYLKSAGKLDTKSRQVFTKVLDNEKKSKQEQLNLQKEARKKREEDAKTYSKALSDSFKDVKEVRFNSNDKMNLISSMTKPTEDIGSGRLVPKLHKKIQEILTGDPKKALIFGKIVMSDVDIESFKKAITTEKTKAVKASAQKKKVQRPDPLEGFLGRR